MLTKESEEEQELGLAIAPPPHEARSRSGGSWGSSSNPGADMAGCELTCARVKLAVAQPQPAPVLSFEAKRGRSKRAAPRRHADAPRTGEARRGGGTGSNSRRARRAPHNSSSRVCV